MFHVKPRPGRELLPPGTLGAYVRMYVWAKDADGFQERGREALEHYGLDSLDCDGVTPYAGQTFPDEDAAEIAGRAALAKGAVLGAFHCYDAEGEA